jgi:hypothetical protein
MGRSSARRTAFPRITLDVVRYACEHPAEASPYYIRESGRDAIKGCMLRVHRRAVELGTRYAKGTRLHASRSSTCTCPSRSSRTPG